MTALNKQALRKLAKALSGKEWVAFVHKASGTYAVGSLGHERGEDIIKWPGFDGQDNAESKAKFIAAASPSTMLELLDELESEKNMREAAEKRIAEHNFENRLLANADRDIKALRQRIAELEARAFNPAILDVIAERQRQQSVEGWTPENDDQYGKSQLLWASSCYLLNTIQPFNRIPMDWPWDSSWWKPTNSRRDLVKAGALILAEIERIDRAAGIGVKGE